MIGKLFEKMIGDCLQFHTISNNFIHQSQLEGFKQRSTIDAGVILTHIICSGWVKNLITSTFVKIVDGKLYFYSPFTLFYFSFLFPF